MNKSRTFSAATLVSLSLALAACGSEQQPAAPAADAPYKEAMDKARGVETTLQQQKESLDRTLQDNEQPTAE
jgi:hypothetical protein